MTDKTLSAADLLGLSNTLTPEKMNIKELGGFIHVRRMSGEAREIYEEEIRERPENAKDYRATLFQNVVCDENGALMFKPEDIPTINQMPTAVLVRVCNKANEINGLLAEVERIEKN